MFGPDRVKVQVTRRPYPPLSLSQTGLQFQLRVSEGRTEPGSGREVIFFRLRQSKLTWIVPWPDDVHFSAGFYMKFRPCSGTCETPSCLLLDAPCSVPLGMIAKGTGPGEGCAMSHQRGARAANAHVTGNGGQSPRISAIAGCHQSKRGFRSIAGTMAAFRVGGLRTRRGRAQ